ncbi:hypothetical protein H1_94 [Efunavirus H1]|uniref:Uncharacterized protein n=1 Tax=Enterococcus phage H1 TaxID=2982918 RepID=A0AAE9T834_9CAUD|nr:hypothetical protein H1_94 [Enterococcus phage H1]
MDTFNLKEGQTYVCTKSDISWWTEEKEYKVFLTSASDLVLVDDEKDTWDSEDLKDLIETSNTRFKLMEKKFDLNKLTTKQLINYVELLKEKDKAENHLNRFIEEMKK